MPSFIAALLGGLLNIAGSLAGRVLIGLGISVVTYTGLTSSLDWLKSSALASLSGLPAGVLGVMSMLKVGESISMIFSAILVRQAIEGLTNGTLRKWLK